MKQLLIFLAAILIASPALSIGEGPWECLWGTNCKGGSSLATVDELDECLSSTDNIQRSCVLGPGMFDTGTGRTFTLGYTGADNEKIWVVCQGSVFHSTAANVTDGAVVTFDVTDLEHDHELYIVGCNFNGSATDTDEVILRFVSDISIHHANNAGRTYLDKVHVGNLGANGGSEKAIVWEGTDSGDMLNVFDSFVESSGHVVTVDQDIPFAGRRTTVSNTRFNGLGSTHTRAAQLCWNDASSSGEGALFLMTGVSLNGCAGLYVTSANLATSSTVLTSVGPDGYAPIIVHDPGGSTGTANLELAINQAITNSSGPLYEANNDNTAAMNVNFDVTAGLWMYSEMGRLLGTPGILMDTEAGSTHVIGQVAGTIMGTVMGSPCWVVPFGPNMLGDNLSQLEGSIFHCGSKLSTLYRSANVQTRVLTRERTAKTANYAMALYDAESFGKPISNAGAGGVIEVSLLAGSTEYIVVVHDDAGNGIQVDPDGTENIVGLAAGLCIQNSSAAVGDMIILEWDGSQWLILDKVGTWASGGACT